MDGVGQGPLGLIAGAGQLPLAVAAGARRRGRHVSAIAIQGLTDAGLAATVDDLQWVGTGDAAAGLQQLLASGAREAVMAGKVPKHLALAGSGQLDEFARSQLEGLDNRRDETLLSRVAAVLEGCGIRVLPQAEFVPELLAGPGPLSQTPPTEAQRADALLGFRVARTVAALDVGQTVVVKDGTILAVEAVEGTDAAIARGAAAAAGACVVKVARPAQDPRFDVPTIGEQTLMALLSGGAKALAFEAGRTLVLDRERLVAVADRNGIAVWGVGQPDLEELANTGREAP